MNAAEASMAGTATDEGHDQGAVVLYATFTAVPGNEAAVAELLAAYATQVRQEAGNVLFEASRRADQGNAFFVYEEYVDDAAFQAHLNAPYGVPFNAALAPLIVEPQSHLTFLRRVRGTPGLAGLA